ncbi:MAG TPA: GNAT family N-acetyltransferase [Steroidobacteraceae bacterium]|jgi:CelD/BcsL family acetyltransferase involved in cellulose biosynthesis|nr:GNAT family N-acetyltransferase [Steroidobacteraceae bacterium]
MTASAHPAAPAALPPSVRLRIVADRAGFDALEGPWRALDASPRVKPFQQYGWIAAWVRTIGSAAGVRLKVVTLWEGDRLIAALPLCVRRYKGLRMLEWAAARVSDYCDAVVDPAVDGDAALRALWNGARAGGGFDVARFSHLRTDGLMFPVMSALEPWTETYEDAGGVSIVWPNGQEWLQGQSAGLRDRVKYNARRMAKAGFGVRLCDSAEKRTRIIDTLITQKRPWLAERGLKSFIDEPGGVEFLQATVAESWARGELHLSTVEKAERIAACDLAFVRDGVIYSYMASFDPEYRKYSFGRVLTDCLFMWACDSGLSRLDLLLGAYDYKTEYNCTLEPVRTLVLPRGLIGSAAVLLYRRQASRRSQ